MIKYHNVIKKENQRKQKKSDKMCVNMTIDRKKKIDQATRIIESCWDDNNPEDGKTFDERLTEAINDCEDEEIQKILKGAAVGKKLAVQ